MVSVPIIITVYGHMVQAGNIATEEPLFEVKGPLFHYEFVRRSTILF